MSRELTLTCDHCVKECKALVHISVWDDDYRDNSREERWCPNCVTENGVWGDDE